MPGQQEDGLGQEVACRSCQAPPRSANEGRGRDLGRASTGGYLATIGSEADDCSLLTSIMTAG